MKRSQITQLPAASAGSMVGAHVIVARGREQHRLGGRPERLGGARQQHVAHDLGAGDPPGSRVSTTPMPSVRRRCGQQRGLGRLAGALAAFEGDEASAHVVHETG